MSVLRSVATLGLSLLAAASIQGASWKLVPATPALLRGSGPMAYDAARQRIVLLDRQGGTWEYDATGWLSVPIVFPSPRYDHAIAYDESRGTIVIAGGIATASYAFLDDTW